MAAVLTAASTVQRSRFPILRAAIISWPMLDILDRCVRVGRAARLSTVERRELFVGQCGAFGYQLRKRIERCFL
jgi:hypothetical protein